ncbi:hypothetical protein BVIET440_250062 [Burkholderia vietnamiensis]
MRPAPLAGAHRGGGRVAARGRPIPPSPPQHEYQRVPAYAIGGGLTTRAGAHTQRGAQGPAPRWLVQLGAAHPGAARAADGGRIRGHSWG